MNNKEKNSRYINGFNIDTSFAESLPTEEEQPKNSGTREFLEWLDVLCVAIISVILIFSFVFRVATIEGKSMMNTLHNGDRVIITSFNYEPRQGDIVVVSRNIQNSAETEEISDEPIIKRVIAVGGQTVDIDFEQGIVYVDGVALEEDYLGSPTHDQYDVQFPIYIPKGHIFIMGDNRGDSLDSRSSRIGDGGIVDNRYVLGHAVFRFFPFTQIGELK